MPAVMPEVRATAPVTAIFTFFFRLDIVDARTERLSFTGHFKGHSLEIEFACHN